MTVLEKDKVGFWKRFRLPIIISSSVACLAISAVVSLMLLMPKDGIIANGVSVNGVSVGGMTVADAEDIIEQNGFFEDSFTIVSGSFSETVNPADIDLEIHESKTALKAYEIARGGNFIKNLADTLKLLTSGIDITPEPSVTKAKLEAVLYNMGVKINGLHQPVKIEESSDDKVIIYPPAEGQDLDVSDVYKSVIDALSKGKSDKIEVTFKKTDAMPTDAELYDMLIIEKQDAVYAIENGEVIISDEIVGREANREEIAQKLPLLAQGQQIELSVTRIIPEVTREMLDSELFGYEIASYKSTYSTKTANRAFNVNRAANSCNNTILLPGEVFSYCDAIGNPSLANGYKIAPVFVNGKHSEGVGGGVCQVSSTIYSAVLYANLEIVERRSHSLPVSYVPKGQDATVSFGSQDFKFRNSTDKPIKMVVSATGGVCKVSILGTKPSVEQKVEIINTIVGVTYPTDSIKYDETLPEGTRNVVEKGSTGYVVDSVRKVYENGNLIKTEQLTRSRYQMSPNEVVIGTKPVVIPEPAPEPNDDTADDTVQEPNIPTSDTPDTAPDITPDIPSDITPNITPDTDIESAPVTTDKEENTKETEV